MLTLKKKTWWRLLICIQKNAQVYVKTKECAKMDSVCADLVLQVTTVRIKPKEKRIRGSQQ
jgi:hypothetical protein